jgi:hypothetical protein
MTRQLAAALLFLLVPHLARADELVWLPGPARGIPRSTSASRDTPLFEVAYGPRAQASIGAEPGLVELRAAKAVWHAGMYAMIGLENADASRVFPPAQLWRGLVGASVSVELPRAASAWLVPGSDLELSLVVGHESDHATEPGSLPPAGPRDIPFGGGGDFIAPDVAVRLPAGAAVSIIVRLVDRVYFNELPLFVGARVASDLVASDLHEGLSDAAGADLVVRWRATTHVWPTLALYGEHLFAREAFTDDGGFFRVMGGVALPGKVGELEPFASFDAGNGKGLIIARRELRLSAGVRYAFF